MRTAHVLPPERAADRGFEMMVLAMVTMNGETMREGTQLGPAFVCDNCICHIHLSKPSVPDDMPFAYMHLAPP